MANYIFVWLATLFIPTQQDDCLEKFNNTLGKERAKVLTLIVDQMDSVINTQEGKTYADRQKALIRPIAYGPDRRLDYNLSSRLEIQAKIKSAGLDSAIWDMYFRQKNGQKIKVRDVNIYGPFMNALRETMQCDRDSLIFEYVNAIEVAGNISPSLVAVGVLDNFKGVHFSNPIVKRILVAEFYIHYFMYPEKDD